MPQGVFAYLCSCLMKIHFFPSWRCCIMFINKAKWGGGFWIWFKWFFCDLRTTLEDFSPLMLVSPTMCGNGGSILESFQRKPFICVAVLLVSLFIEEVL